MIKRLMSITLVVALVLTQTAIAGAFVSDDTVGPYVAKATVTGAAVANLSVAIKFVEDNTGSSDINWSGINIGDTWEISTEYLEVTYEANQVGWGVQIYTDNMNNTTNPYTGDPTTDPSEQPVGLIGVDSKHITCPIAMLVTDSTITDPGTNLKTPEKTSTADLPTSDPAYALPGDPDYREWFTTGYDQVPGGAHEKVWFWLKDVSGTAGVDLNDNHVFDLVGSFGEPGYELVAGFSTTGDDYATIVNTFGSSSGWAAAVGGDMQRDTTATSPIIVYFAADFSNANELQEYKTETLELEIYHE
jgi:hypothetical protein